MKRFAAVILMLFCLIGCGQKVSYQPAGSPAFPDPKPGDGGVLTSDLTAEGTVRKSFIHSEPAFDKPKQDGTEFILRLSPDDGIPAGIDLSGIEVWVYDMVMRPTSSDAVQEFDSGGVYQYFSNESGEVHFFREKDNYISLDLQSDTVPDGIGVKQYGLLFDPEENSADYVLSVPRSAQISVGNHLDDIQISLLDADGEHITAVYSYTPVYTRRALAPDQVEVSGVVKCGDLELPVFHIVDLSGEEEYYKLKKLEKIRLVTEQEQELLDSFGPYF